MTLPDGFRYLPDAVDPFEERQLIEAFAALPFEPYVMRGYAARRRIVHFHPPPPFLLPVRDAVLTRAAIEAGPFVHALVTEYTPGAQAGWHRDMPQYGPVVVGISLGTACRMRFRRTVGARVERAAILLEPRSVAAWHPAGRGTPLLDYAPHAEGTSLAIRMTMPANTQQKIAWRHDFERALADAKAQRKLVLLDFTAAPM